MPVSEYLNYRWRRERKASKASGSFWKGLDAEFLYGVRAGPLPGIFDVRVKKGIDPLAPRELEKKTELVRPQLTAFHAKLLERYALPSDPNPQLIDSMSRLFAWSTFEDEGIEGSMGMFLFEPYVSLYRELLEQEPLFTSLVTDNIEEMSSSERLKLHDKLTHLETALADADTYVEKWAWHLFLCGAGVLIELPEQLRTASDDADMSMSCPLLDCLSDPHEQLSMMLSHFIGENSTEIRKLGLFTELRDGMVKSVIEASGFEPKDLAKKEPDHPLNHLDTPATELAERFLGQNPLSKFLLTPVPYAF